MDHCVYPYTGYWYQRVEKVMDLLADRSAVQIMDLYKCTYCKKQLSTFREVISHLIESHGCQELKYLRQRGCSAKVCNFKIIPEQCREEGRVITIIDETEKIHLSKRYVAPKDSPLKKMCKYANDEEFENVCLQDTELPVVEESREYRELLSLIPSVIDEMKQTGKLEDYIAFNRLVSEGKFPLNNIAYLLFTDVVRWFNLEKSTSFMRYSDEVKLFWRTGLRLFHGRFLRFMGGPKNSGQVNEGTSKLGLCSTEDSLVNFVVPNRNSLKEDIKFVKDSVPGILHEMLTTISNSNINDCTKTFKICVDGKKINPTSKGEIDLWGYEDQPTFKEKQQRLNDEIVSVNAIKDILAKEMSFGRSSTEDCIKEVQKNIVLACRSVVTILSGRLRDLRQLRVKKELFLHKLTEKSGSDWRNSQYAMVISSIKTTIYRIENTAEDLLTCIDGLCKYSSIVCQASANFSSDTLVPLMNQGNFVCLGCNDNIDDPPLIKQRSDTWHKLRSSFNVTGSTIYTAVGMDGLKKQKYFLEEKAGKRIPIETPPDLQRKFDYGTINEPNAIATVASKFLPAFHPGCCLYEEGCYVVTDNGKDILLVSPDGSVRDNQNEINVQFGLEIKCPYPGKTYTTEVHYGLPRYYVTQILSEMCALGVEKLLFVSYTAESTTIHQASFDEKLWTDIVTEICCVNPNTIPKKLSANIPSLKAKIIQYCKTNVHLVAEIPSCKAGLCTHTSSDGRIHHVALSDHEASNVLFRQIHKICIKAETLIRECQTICAQKASEVLVFLVSDLDRLFKPEIPHAFPIAYGLKGYSMKTDVMRKMISDVLNALFMNGMYTPVVSYDGQWAKLAFQTSDGEPLTLLELQKKVYNDVKNKTANSLTHYIFQCGVVNVSNMEECEDQFVFEKRKSGISVGLKEGHKRIQTSSHLAAILKGLGIQKNSRKGLSDDKPTSIDEVLSDVPADIIATIDDDMIGALTTVNSETVSCTSVPTNKTSYVSCEDMERLFTDSTVEKPKDHMDDESQAVAVCIPEYSELQHSDDEIGMAGLKPFDVTEVTTRADNGAANEITTRQDNTIITNKGLSKIHCTLKENTRWSRKWQNTTLEEFQNIVKARELMSLRLTKEELLFCMKVHNDQSECLKVRVCKSWSKQRIADTFHEACISATVTENPQKKVTRKTPPTLKHLSQKVVKSYPKRVINVIVAEHEFPNKVRLWREKSTFGTSSQVGDIGDILWFSVPEYNASTLAYIFSLLDIHHLLTNCRVKICKDGLPERHINKIAWFDVAKGNKTNLKLSHVEDLVDKQSDAIARETFSVEVECEMKALGYINEAEFCRLIRHFYEAEDEPGISSKERCARRIEFRNWLLDGVNFCKFPPFGSHINGIPQIMFQGFLTNIDRRMQMFPYVKSGRYNVRSLGSLDAENFFGEFQDLDPKGSGVIKAEEIPSALEMACQLNHTRLLPERPFHMTLSKAKAYPVHKLENESAMEVCDSQAAGKPYIYPTVVDHIILRDHMFDTKSRAKRKAQRKLATISGPDVAARGMAPVRQHHRCDESKILPHKRLGIDIESNDI